MLNRLCKWLRFATGERSIEIEEESPNRLVLRSSSVRTVFDRVGSVITQDGCRVAALSLVERVELHQERGQDGPPNWSVTVCVAGARTVRVGESTDQTAASLVGARIATITNRPVSVRP